MPIIPPISALKAAIMIMVWGVLLWSINLRIIRGANFCQVAKIIQDIQVNDVITDGNQKWKGTIPSFNIMADIKMKLVNRVDEVIHWDILVINIILDPRACAIKYLIAASVSWLDLELVIIGMNLSILISIDIQRKTQLVEDMAMIDLVIRVVEIISINGLLV